MVLKPFAHIARQSLAKAVAHGYAQSVVAASQSTYVSSNTINQLSSNNKLSRNQLHNALPSASSPSSAGAKATNASSSSGELSLTAYINAWHQLHQTGEDGDRSQSKSHRRVGRKPDDDDANAIPEDEVESVPPHLTKAAINEDVSAQVEEAVAREIQVQEEQAQAEEASADGVADSSFEYVASVEISDQARVASDHIVWLAKSKEFADVPIAFESLLQDGLTPTVEAYNALLAAAIQLHPRAVNAIPRALDVYSDMLHRQVIPDENTYETLLQLLATRAHDIIQAKETLEQERIRYGSPEQPGEFMLQSKELERAILDEDHSLSIAVKLFVTAIARHSRLVFPLGLYRDLITACSQEGKIEDMVRIYSHMESRNVTPHAAIFPAMIDAFGRTGDLKSAVECYSEYRSLAVSDDNGFFSIVQRLDGEVYASLIRAYLFCGKQGGAQQFLSRIHSSFDGVTENREERLAAVETVIVQKAFVRHFIDSGDYNKALEHAKCELHNKARDQAISQICIAAADAGDLATASKAYDSLSTSPDTRQAPAMSLLALHVREGNLSAARSLWMMLNAVGRATPEMVQPTAMYVVALLKSEKVDEGLHQARNMFARIRKSSATLAHSTTVDSTTATIAEQITESLHLFHRTLAHTAFDFSPQQGMNILWTMFENGSFAYPLAEHAIVSLSPTYITRMGLDDLNLALHVQASIVANRNMIVGDVAHSLRFTHMLKLALSAGLPVDPHTVRLVDQAVNSILFAEPDLVQRWRSRMTTAIDQSPLSAPQNPAAMVEASITNPPVNPETYDPYARTTDMSGSNAIVAELEVKARDAETNLNRALSRIIHMQGAGRHPRYIVYAKIIGAAAKLGRMDLVHKTLGMARNDIPIDMAYKAVRYGWVPILDAMIGACLNAGDREQASQFHEELLGLGYSPSANTFGLYITTLKESTRSSDEATEAVNIFRRAVSEGVEPTSFLYNAVIGKLGKARRIDDCLAYFAEMRSQNIRPTSITYGTIVNALCRVNDERFAEQMFEEMESMPNYSPRPAPYNSIIQYFLNIKHDRHKVLRYFDRMLSRGIRPTTHTYKLLIDAHASIHPVDMRAAENVLSSMRAGGLQPECVHYASLIHGKGSAQRDLPAALGVFNDAVADKRVRLQPILYQALFEVMVANGRVEDTEPMLQSMKMRNIEMNGYIANTLIQGWASAGNLPKAKAVYDCIGRAKREPSTYEAMVRGFLAAEDTASAADVVVEMKTRGYPPAVTNKIAELV